MGKQYFRVRLPFEYLPMIFLTLIHMYVIMIRKYTVYKISDALKLYMFALTLLSSFQKFNNVLIDKS